MEQQNERKEWRPDPQKYATVWKKMWFDIIDSRRWSIRQTHGDECAKLYTFVPEEYEFFMQYGKLPHNAIGMKTAPQSTEWLQPPCEKCDQQTAKAIVKLVDDYHAGFWKAADLKFGDKRKAYEERIAKQRKAVEATEQYKADKEARKQLDDYLSQFVANLKADDKEAQHPAGQQGEQAIADQTQTAPKAEQGQDANEAAQ
jgi:hypothetical protein